MSRPIVANPETRRGIIARIKSLFTPEERLKGADLAKQIGTLMYTARELSSPKADAETAVSNGYLLNSYVFAAVRFIASRAASVPWGVYQVKTDTERRKSAITALRRYDRRNYASPKAAVSAYRELRKEAIRVKALVAVEPTTHPIFDFLANPTGRIDGSWYDAVYKMTAYRELLGYVPVILNGIYSERENYTSLVESIDIPLAQHYEADVSESSTIRYANKTHELPYSRWIRKKNGVIVNEYPSGRVMVWKYPSLVSEIYGDSPMRGSGIIPTAMLNELDAWSLTAMQGRGAFGGIVTVANHEFTDQAEIDTETKRLNERLKSVKGGVVLMGHDVKYHNVSMKPTDYTENQITALGRRIALEFDLPSLVLGDMDKLNHSNYETALRQAYQGKIIPVLDSLRETLNAWVCASHPGGYILDYEVDSIEALSEDADRISKRVTDEFKAGVITRDEARAELGHTESEDDSGGAYYPEIIAASRAPITGLE